MNMGNTVDYVTDHCHESFKVRPFSKEDALVLSQLSYLKFDKLMPATDEKTYTLKDLNESPEFDSLFVYPKYEKPNRALFDATLKAPRFKGLKVCFYINRIDVADETQFCAITFILPGGHPFIAFRGTDETILGWQEDFRLALDKPITGQKLSARYLNDVGARVRGEIMVGGHSKGGNLAMFSSMQCSEVIRERISKIYSFDGPGFRPDLLDEYGYGLIRDRVVSVIPKSSVVGLLLSGNRDSIVVSSKRTGMKQHDPYNWIIEDGKLSETHLTDQHVMLLDSFNQWMFSLDEEHLNGFISMLVGVLDATQADTTLELTGEAYKYAMNVIRAAKDLDDENKEFLSGLLKSFYELMKDRMKTEIQTKIEVKREELNAKREVRNAEKQKRKKNTKTKKDRS